MKVICIHTYVYIYIYVCCFMHLWSVLSDYVNSNGYVYLTYYLEQQRINIPPSKISHPCWATHPFVDEGRWYLWLATKRWGESNESQRVKIDQGEVASQRAKGLKFRENSFFKFGMKEGYSDVLCMIDYSLLLFLHMIELSYINWPAWL